MNKRLVKKKRPATAGRGQTARKASTRAAASRKSSARQAVKKSAPIRAAKVSATTQKVSATTQKVSATTQKVSATTQKVSATTQKVSTTAQKVSTTAHKAPTTTKKPTAVKVSSAKVSGATKLAETLPISEFMRIPEAEKIVSTEVRAISIAEVTAVSQSVRMHKFRVGQTVSYTSSPISRPGASGSYQVVRLLPSDGDDYQYRIKNPGEAFERVAKESQLELDR
jgi:hypothetical protein